MRRWLILVALLAGQLILSASPSSACSCGGGDPRSGLEAADAAFVGTAMAHGDPRPDEVYGQVVIWTFRVDRALKGPIGPTIDVESPLGGAACGLEVQPRDVAGLLLWRDSRGWNSNLCAQVNPALLIRAAAPLPLPDGAGPVRLLVGGSYGDARTIALDGRGRTLAYGLGEGTTSLISVCPRSKRAAEIAIDRSQPAPGSLFLTVRRLPTLTVEWETEIKAPTRAFRPFLATGLSCRNREGTDVMVATFFRGRTPHGEILRFRTGQVRAVFRGPADWVSFAPGNVAYVSGGRRVFEVDLKNGRAEHLPQVPGGTGPFAVSSDGDRAAVVVNGFGSKRSVVLIDLRDSRVQVTKPIRDGNVGGSIIWLDKRRFLFSQIDGEGLTSYVFDTSLRRVDTLVGWNADSMAVASRVLYGLGSGELQSVQIHGHQVDDLRTFDSSEMGIIVAVPPASGLEVPIGAVKPISGRDVSTRPRSSRRGSATWPIPVVIAVLGASVWFAVRKHRSRSDWR